MRASETLDRACAEAVELARTAAVNRAGAMGVGAAMVVERLVKNMNNGGLNPASNAR